MLIVGKYTFNKLACAAIVMMIDEDYDMRVDKVNKIL